MHDANIRVATSRSRGAMGCQFIQAVLAFRRRAAGRGAGAQRISLLGSDARRLAGRRENRRVTVQSSLDAVKR